MIPQPSNSYHLPSISISYSHEGCVKGNVASTQREFNVDAFGKRVLNRFDMVCLRDDSTNLTASNVCPSCLVISRGSKVNLN